METRDTNLSTPFRVELRYGVVLIGSACLTEANDEALELGVAIPMLTGDAILDDIASRAPPTLSLSGVVGSEHGKLSCRKSELNDR